MRSSSTMVQKVVLSTLPLPYKGIGSWTTMYNYYLQQYEHAIDCIISPYVANRVEGIEYISVHEPKFAKDRISMYWKHYKYRGYWRALKNIIDPNGYVVVQIIDNVGLLRAIDAFARKTGRREKIKILFFIHGYDYVMEGKEREAFYGMIDDLIVLTHASYRHQLAKTSSMPCEVTQIYNGIDSEKFKRTAPETKEEIREKLNLKKDTVYFLWLSQERPKKGLHIVLRAWEILTERFPNIELLIIGTREKIEGKGIRWLGRIPNDKLPQYYQSADFYLFPTLWHEGFGLSLAEAMKCGCVCIASDIDPVGEVLGNGRYGRLVSFPHSPESWAEVIAEELHRYENNDKNNPYQEHIPDKVYDLNVWCDNINRLVTKWEKRLLLQK